MSNISNYHCEDATDLTNCTTCLVRYSGEFCQVDNLEYVGFSVFLWIYQIIFLLAFCGIFVLILYLIYKNVTKFGKSLSVIAFWPAYVILPGIICRIIFLIDPVGIRLIFDERSFFVALVLYLPAVFMFGGSVLTISVWLDVMVGLGKKYSVTSNFIAPKIISAVFAFVFLAVLVVLLIVFRDASSKIALYSNLLVIAYGVILVVFVAVYLPLINKKFSKSQLKGGVRKITRSLLYSCVVFGSLIPFMIGIITLKGIMTTNDPAYVWIYFLLQIGVRVCELGMISCSIYSTLSIQGNGGTSSTAPHQSGTA
eukprot:TRINITY_DN1496_c0_g1_i1.p1 TRINITY_DN1496_c0_g1~~TRINITY_DN1496_c0_g1_i1.p1  ORF type:complete len:328 (-),score=35.18 TRINITY_DN1496_c0_g1_i1:58-990(-)